MTKRSMKGASSSGFCPPGPPAITVVAHPQGIRVREGQTNGSPHVPVVTDDAVQFPSDILGRGPNLGQDPRNDSVLETLIKHIARTPNPGCSTQLGEKTEADGEIHP